MEFEEFIIRSSKIKNLPLPGAASHIKMAPEIRINELKEAAYSGRNPKQAAVMALFYPNKQYSTNLLLILRKTYKGVHSNQIGFPGGKAEQEDENLLATALRETEEEVGVPVKKIEVVRPLSQIYIPPSNFEVHPFFGFYKEPEPFVIQETEVESLVEVSLTDFLDERKMFTQNLSTSYAKNIDVPAFKLNGYTVWGATAMMLNEIKELLKQVI